MRKRPGSKQHTFKMVVWVVLFVGTCLPTTVSAVTWPEVLTLARGQTVDWLMIGSPPGVNDFIKGYLAPRLKDLYGIALRPVSATNISEIMEPLLAGKAAGRLDGGEVDLIWINGSHFQALKQGRLLYGPFANGLPNQRLVNWDKLSILGHSGGPLDHLASPWGNRQVVIVYDAKRTPRPPATMADLLDWIREHPGRFTYPAPPDESGSAFVRQIFYHVAGGASSWQAPLDQGRFEQAAAGCYKLLRDIAPFLWRQGRTYPESSARLSTLFAGDEIDFSVTHQPAEASMHIASGAYPDTVRTFVFEGGTIGQTHFVVIPFDATDKAGAMTVANFLLSPEAQLKKADPGVWGDLPVIETSRLDYTWREKFQTLSRGIATLPDAILQKHQLPEPPSELWIQLEKEWQAQVPGKR